MYNPTGASTAEQYRFPYKDAEFSFALATSVFTHLLPRAAEHYIAETARVLKSGGKFLSTWFLLEEVDHNRFPHRFEQHAQASLHAPEQAVAFQKSYIESVFVSNNFVIEGIYQGDWSGRPDHIESMQDVIVVRRN